jgi:hypothetical protein
MLANQDSWEEVKNIFQIHNKAPEQPLNSPVTQTPQQFEKTYKRNDYGINSKRFRDR